LKIKFYFIIVVLSLFLISCSSEKSKDDYATVNPNKEELQTNSYVSLDSVPDSDGLLTAVNTSLNEIGFGKVLGFDDINVADTGTQIDVEILIKNDYSDFSISCMYLTILSNPEWEVLTIKNTDTENSKCFWIYEDLKNKVDIYDYKTGELISKKTEEFKSSDEQQKEYEDKLNNISDEFNKNMEALEKKYN
jgi:hypothetical protein